MKEQRALFDYAISIIVEELGVVQSTILSEKEYDDKIAKGQLNYVIYAIVKRFTEKHGEGYFKISNMIGAVHDSEDELRRRLLYPYEDKVIIKNGDVK